MCKDSFAVSLVNNPEQGSGRSSGQWLYSTYSSYACYPPRDNGEVAIPTWELTQEKLENLNRTYIIAQDFGPEEMQQKIKDLMYPLIDQVLQGNHEGFSFNIPSNQDEEVLEYSKELCFPLLKRGGKAVNRDFYSGTSTHTAAKTIWTLKVIYENLESGFVGTLRDVFYRRSILFRNQNASNRIVTDLCYIFGCTRRSLNISSEDGGWVCGSMMNIHLVDGKTIDCSHKVHIPDDRKIATWSFDPELKYILVVEKGSIFNYLEQFKFHEIQKCIIITSCGFPDVLARRFVKWLEKESKVPVIGVADADPAGIEIMRCYSQGSANLSLENFNLAVPSLRWIGVSLIELEGMGIKLNNCNSEVLSAQEVDRLGSFKLDKYTKLSSRWKQAVNKMLSVGRKVSFEVMHEKGSDYVAVSWLPALINNALGIQAT